MVKKNVTNLTWPMSCRDGDSKKLFFDFLILFLFGQVSAQFSCLLPFLMPKTQNKTNDEVRQRTEQQQQQQQQRQQQQRHLIEDDSSGDGGRGGGRGGGVGGDNLASPCDRCEVRGVATSEEEEADDGGGGGGGDGGGGGARSLLLSCPRVKILPAEILVNLLKIQASESVNSITSGPISQTAFYLFIYLFVPEYLDDHPCLCTSRFRHALHHLDQERHRRLASLCGRLQALTTVRKEGGGERERERDSS